MITVFTVKKTIYRPWQSEEDPKDIVIAVLALLGPRVQAHYVNGLEKGINSESSHGQKSLTVNF